MQDGVEGFEQSIAIAMVEQVSLDPNPSPDPNPTPQPHARLFLTPPLTPTPMLEQELGRPLMEVFSEFADEPVAAASLAQVYRAVLRESGEVVAVKVQRPGVQSLVSKDLYVLRRAAEVYQGLIKRFAPQQRTDYVALLNEWAVGFYTELDFKNEAANMHTNPSPYSLTTSPYPQPNY